MFLDREEELKILMKAAKTGDKVLIIGLRGYGKTSLAKEFYRRLMDINMKSVFVNCLKILSPMDLIELLKEQVGIQIDGKTSKEVLEKFFYDGEKAGVKVFIIDEFTTLFRRFGMIKPYRGFGGPMAVAEHFKSILDDLNSAVIALDTSFKDVKEFVKDYSSPLFRQFTIEIKLNPLPIEYAIQLAKIKAKEWGVELDDQSAIKLAELFGGVPFYIIVASRSLRKGLSVERAFEEELIRGFLNEYFSLLLEKFSTTEQQVLYLISRGKRRFFEIDEMVEGAAQALESLQIKGIVERFEKSRREVYYRITDKVFEAWLALNEQPRLKKLSFERVYVSSLSFESLIRESLFRLTKPIKVKDVIRREVQIGPYKNVKRLDTPTVEVDVLAETYDRRYHVYEVYFGGRAGIKKLNQLKRIIGELIKLGYNVDDAFLVSYFGFEERVLEEIRKIGGRIYLLGKEQIRKIVKRAGLHL